MAGTFQSKAEELEVSIPRHEEYMKQLEKDLAALAFQVKEVSRNLYIAKLIRDNTKEV
jgi:hypothetical protein